MILERILERKRAQGEALRAPKRSLAAALARPGLSVIAEIKRASPSRGMIREDLDPADLLRRYEEGGADAVSVLTEREFFGGDPETLRALRPRTELPLLRKDFILDAGDIYQSLFLGADAVLLIAAALSDEALRELSALAATLGMETLVEVHDEEELLRALRTDAPLLGFNNRDLRDFSVDLGTTGRLLELLRRREPGGTRRVVAESGVRTPSDAATLRDLGADGILVGEALVRSPDPAALIAALREAAR